MKLFSYASLTLPMIIAQEQQASNGVLSTVESYFEAFIDEADIDTSELSFFTADNSTETPLRTLASGWANSMVNSIDGYACWCYFENDHGKGRGQVQNDLDAQCKVLHDGYSCILMDSEEEGDSCIPWEEEYTAPSGVGWWSKTGDDESLKAALQKDCWRRNKKRGDCAQRACIVEGYFSINLFGLLTNGKKYDPKLKHDMNKWDPEDNCPLKANTSEAEKKCCGEYPIRFPYRHTDGRRECCNGHTFNAEFLQCCDNKDIKLTCF